MEKKEKIIIELDNFNVKSTGADGGRFYISTEIEFKGKKRKLIAYFLNKSDEKRLNEFKRIRIQGDLIDEGGEYIDLFDSIIIN